jgi:uncharacterized membrane protein YhhN
MGQGGIMASIILRLSIFAGVSYILSWSLYLDPTLSTLWKGAGVTLLAIYAAMHARDLDGWMLALVMAFGAAGDMLLEIAGFTAGGAAFAAGHIVAIALFLRNRRDALTLSQRLLAWLIIPATVFTVFTLPADRAAAPAIAAYAFLLSAMAAAAWTSRFPRFRTGIGAMMFVASDILIFARMGPLGDTVSVGIAVWLLYYFGQMLIVVGVRQGLDR